MIKCPLLEKDIEEGTCFDIQMCAEHMCSIYDNPENVREVKDYEKICLECNMHDN